MASRALSMFLHCRKKVQVVYRSAHVFHNKHGTREIVGYGLNSEPSYIDSFYYPFPSIRYKEVTPDIQALRNKEKGDWRKLSIEEKKLLYRTSFRQTFAEFSAPTGDAKYCVGIALILSTVCVWFYIIFEHYATPPPVITFEEDRRIAQLKRIIALDMRGISGISGATK